MSDTTDDPFTPEQLTELVLLQAENSAQIAKDLTAMAHQSLAALVMNALLLHELERVGLVSHEDVITEAIRRAKSIHPPELGAGVARVIKTVFDGEVRAEDFSTGIGGSQTDAKH
ncbi:hypothetical protein [Methylobacterium sp. PvR107]|uniref:hypothetical protein n=1 Tax=Methylobacterium sp. PvR107 TaxID=2806597 RepID=UPI001AEBA192|nr:hypothetical protein [Methylobacterium sp. PvR107]MBP1179271.1 hypothetical protein [Methylobacterium sp. PvR107]